MKKRERDLYIDPDFPMILAELSTLRHYQATPAATNYAWSGLSRNI